MKLNNSNFFPLVGKTLILVFVTIGMFACSKCQDTKSSNLLSNVMPIDIDFKSSIAKNNSAAYVTSQCYTKTQDPQGNLSNPCFSCHIDSIEPNYINDGDLQESYAMSTYTKKNRFSNLFLDRSSLVSKIDDQSILNYVKEDNYKDQNTLKLKTKLTNIPKAWDINNNGIWDGYIPDCYFNFDNEGFDLDPQGNYTLWRAFAYYPFLGTFWPTNGSTDDVLIRLANVFALDEQKNFNLEVYKINLAIVEALIKQKNIQIDPTDETLYGVDLNQNGHLDLAQEITFFWKKPTYDSRTKKLHNFSMSYVGHAKDLLLSNEQLLAPGLYPKDTEFLHSVRYIDLEQKTGKVKMAPRMKELRYAKKNSWNSYPQISNASMSEIVEKDLFPDRLRSIAGNSEEGLQTGLGWTYQGFIEDAQGELRPQNYEETLYCIGCHSGIGAIADSTFVFQRKFDYNATLQGWYHWTQDPKGFKNIKEPKTKEGKYEYSFYLQQNKAGDEFRSNEEVLSKFFDNKVLKEEQLDLLHNDISHLIIPSAKRALELNKAYFVIVKEQSYIYGRDAHIKPLLNVHKSVQEGQSTQLKALSY